MTKANESRVWNVLVTLLIAGAGAVFVSAGMDGDYQQRTISADCCERLGTLKAGAEQAVTMLLRGDTKGGKDAIERAMAQAGYECQTRTSTRSDGNKEPTFECSR